jgi:3-hydroxybutyryl-CoA dehydratase
LWRGCLNRNVCQIFTRCGGAATLGRNTPQIFLHRAKDVAGGNGNGDDVHSGLMTKRQRYLDDFQPGETFESSARTLTEKHLAAFADMTGDAHPIHYDADYARAKGWDGPIAHGLMLLGLCALGAAPISRELTDSMVAMLGNDVRYKRPAFVGDTLTPQFMVLAVEPKDDDRGILRLAIKLRNQRNELVLEGSHVLMLRRRDTLAGTATK